MSIRTKFVAILLLLSIVPISVLGWVEIRQSRRTLEAQIGADSLELARLSLQRVNEYLYSKYEDVRSWSHIIEPGDLTGKDGLSETSDHLTHIVETYGEYYYAVVRDDKGQVIASSDAKLLGRLMPLGPSFRDALAGKPNVQDVVYDEVAGARAVMISFPIRDPRGLSDEIAGVLSAALKWDKVHSMITDLRLGGRPQDMANHVMLANRDGLAISCHHADDMFVTNLCEAGLASSRYAKQGKEGFLLETSEHGRPSFSAYTYQRTYKDLPALGWHLVVLQDPNRVFASADSLKRSTIGTLVVVGVLLAGVCFVCARQVTRPILAIASTARAIAAGQMDRRVQVHSRDEIGTLARSFNDMMDELKRSNDGLHAAQDFSDNILRSMRDGLLVVDPDGIVVRANRGIAKLLGRTRRQIEGEHISTIVPADQVPPDELCEGGEFGNREISVTVPGGGKVPVLFSASPMKDDGGNVVSIVCVVRDITKRKRAQRALQDARSRLLSARESQRRKIAAELHDSIGQRMVALQLSVQNVLDTDAGQLGGKAVSRLSDIEQQCAELIRGIRAICRGLYPPTLVSLGIVPSLRQMAGHCDNAGLAADVVCPPEFETARFAPDVEIALFRVAQEAINNTLQHSDARTVTIALDCRKGWVTLRVTDDGKGFDPDAVEPGGLGMTSMGERATAIGGELSISSGPDGTTITLHAPAVDGPIADGAH